MHEVPSFLHNNSIININVILHVGLGPPHKAMDHANALHNNLLTYEWENFFTGLQEWLSWDRLSFGNHLKLMLCFREETHFVDYNPVLSYDMLPSLMMRWTTS